MIQTRQDFISWIERNFTGIPTHQSSPLWIPEHDLYATLCDWFVTVRQIREASGISKADYWMWCSQNLQGYVRCFWSNRDDDKECWGFTNYHDIALWLLKWSH